MNWRSVRRPRPGFINIGAVRIAPVGNYALTFTWTDGHATGIYPWEALRALADGFGATQGGGA